MLTWGFNRYWLLPMALLLLSAGQGLTQEAPSKPGDAPVSPSVTIPEANFPGNLDTVWEKLLEVLKNHEIPIASADKATGTLNTATTRYFKITSAKFPPVQADYRDTYTIQVTSTGSATKVQIQRKFEVYDPKARNWVEGNPTGEKVGVSAEDLFETLKTLLAEAKSPEKSP